MKTPNFTKEYNPMNPGLNTSNIFTNSNNYSTDIGEDPIDSKAFVDTVNSIDIKGNELSQIAVGCIMLELKRLIIMCAKANGYTIINTWYNELVSNPAINNIEYCIFYIINNRNIDKKLFNNIILYNINALFDLCKLNQNKERDAIEEFIDYFIKTFTTQK